ncbi:PREDICTED: uncharacterized protein LOC108378049 [Rhagoletis zephyria]|uniref:uncharacterized protein LOC108378049 n=1 Tax=Rhagoletis zephyria TaxID=28612 RepID=UPI0008117639|nr:PREDICTED: uncharacterized protein LOC108378049 [Rhagoletis zephyria]
MRSHRLTAFILLSLAIAAVVAMPLKRQNARLRPLAHSARQVVATTAQPVQAKTGYPPSGFRPRIPFELPNERQPKVLPDVTSTTVATAKPEEATTTLPEETARTGGINVDVEVVVESEGKVQNDRQAPSTNEIPTADAAHEIEVVVDEVNPADEVEAHTPAIEYGPPVDETNASVGDDSATTAEPVGHFQPPNREAEEFGAPTLDTIDTAAGIDAGSAAGDANADAPVQPVADFPMSSAAAAPITPNVAESEHDDSSAAPIDVSGELDGQAAEQHEPAVTYGPPSSSGADEEARLPADTYGPPGGADADAITSPEAEEEEFGVELNELEPAETSEEADLTAEQIELLNGLSELQSGRLIFVPADGSNFRQIFFAAPSPQQRRAGRNERFVRL